MAESLQEQLLKMGVVNKKNVKQSQHQKRQEDNKARKAKKAGQSSQATKKDVQAFVKANREKQKRDLELNKARDQKLANTALQAEVKQMMEPHLIELKPTAEVPYHFTHGKAVKKLYIDAEQQQKLTSGQLAIGYLQDRYYLIPDVIAQKIELRSPDSVIRISPEVKMVEDNDPYADYEIPDDLMW
jgi:hypothetical protein